MSQHHQNYDKSSSSPLNHGIQIELPPKKQSTNSISFSKASQKSIVISIPNHDNSSSNIISTQNKPQPKSISDQQNKIQQNHGQYEFTAKELEMKEIARQNQQIILSNQFQLTYPQTIFENEHYQISIKIHQHKPTYSNTPIIVNEMSTIGSTIEIHKNATFSICVLNFADPFKPGGGYLNGRSPQEETLCRQTLLYPTLFQSQMYSFNQMNEANVYYYDTMIYSPNVHVIRDDNYSRLNENTFMINVISAPAVDNRKNLPFLSSEEIMERRIRKIISLAIDRQNDVIILGAFGCGVFRNDPKVVSQIFKKILVEEGLKDFFKLVVFPIYKSEVNYNEFKETFCSNLDENKIDDENAIINLK